MSGRNLMRAGAWHVRRFKQTVRELMEITERQHRQLLRHMRQEQGWAGQPLSNTGQVGQDTSMAPSPLLMLWL